MNFGCAGFGFGFGFVFGCWCWCWCWCCCCSTCGVDADDGVGVRSIGMVMESAEDDEAGGNNLIVDVDVVDLTVSKESDDEVADVVVDEV